MSSKVFVSQENIQKRLKVYLTRRTLTKRVLKKYYIKKLTNDILIEYISDSMSTTLRIRVWKIFATDGQMDCWLLTKVFLRKFSYQWFRFLFCYLHSSGRLQLICIRCDRSRWNFRVSCGTDDHTGCSQNTRQYLQMFRLNVLLSVVRSV